MWRRLSPPERTRPAAARVAALAAFVGIWSVGLVLVQHHYYPSPPSAQRNMPTLVADYAGPLQHAAGDVMMLGDPVKLLLDDGAASRDFLIGSAWYVSPHPVQNTYTTIGYKSYVSRYCIGFIGNTCKRALGEMFSEEPTTGRRRVDLLSISTLLLVRKDFPAPVMDHPPAGWHVADKSPLAVTWVRDHLAPTAGGVVWSSPGTTVQQLSSSERTVRFRVRAVGRGGGKVAVSRLAWPGYSVDGGRLASAVDDYLLTVDVPASSTNKIVTVHYDPPAWALEVGAWYLGVGVGVLWSLLLALAFWRRRLGASPRAM
jgi:hypothetical protein